MPSTAPKSNLTNAPGRTSATETILRLFGKALSRFQSLPQEICLRPLSKEERFPLKMNMSETELRQAALRKQLEIMEARIVVHGNRVWQLPFTYFGFSAIAASIAVENDSSLPAHWLFFALSVIGLLVLWAMADACKSYVRTGSAMNLVEQDLKLTRRDGKTSTSGSSSHSAPHFSICIAAIVALFLGGLWYSP